MAALALALSSCPLSAGATEDVPNLGPLHHAEEVSDQALGGIRARYLEQGRIVRFGVEMVSTWQTNAGQAFRAAATLSIGLEDRKPQLRFVPTLTVVESAGAALNAAPASDALSSSSPSPGQTLNAASGGAGLASVSGVAQSIQVAGDGNQVTNSASVTVTSSGAGLPMSSAAMGPSQMSAVTSSGTLLSAGINANGISVGISVPGAGRLVQQIRTSGGTAGTGILQMAQTTGDMHRAQNHLNVFVQLAPDGMTRSLARDHTLNALKGMRGMGVF